MNIEEIKTEPCRYDLTDLPGDVIAVSIKTPEDFERNRQIKASKWSGVYPIPQIGDRVTININKLGSGKVESYFVEHGWLGIKVRLENDPEWHAKQCRGTKYEGCALVFGNEL